MTNVMRTIRIEKLTLNIGTGKEKSTQERGVKLIKHLTGKDPVLTITNKRIPNWGLRPGLPIGCKLTIRDDSYNNLISKFIEAKNFSLPESCFDNYGNISFGIHEYVDIAGVEYNPEIGMMGFQITITLERPGFRIKRRKIHQSPIPKKHRISREDAMQFMKEQFKVKFGED